MSVEASVRDEDNWFAGERKTLRFTVAGVLPDEDVADWQVTYTFHRRRTETVLFTKTTVAAQIVRTAPNVLDVAVLAGDTAALGAGAYHHVLRRTDVGAEQVLAFGTVTLRHPAQV